MKVYKGEYNHCGHNDRVYFKSNITTLKSDIITLIRMNMLS